jgi:hypothetical protein
MESGRTYELLVPFIDLITSQQYEAFIEQLPNLQCLAPEISELRNDREMDDAASVASAIFSALIESIKINLSHPDKGICVIDIPSTDRLTATENAYWGVGLALALAHNVFRPARDRVNDTPYTIYAASHQHSEKLTKMGLPPISPETRLGFHTDGLLTEGRVAMPHNIMLYNIAISYEKPGSFYWIPFSLWEDKNKYMDLLGIGNRYRISVTPSVYEFNGNDARSILDQYINAPIFVNDQAMRYPMYLNGIVTARSDGEPFDKQIVDNMKESLTKNRARFVVPQRTRRIIFARNIAGAHARDIFESPIPGATFTRVFLRSVDTHCVELG